MKIIPVAFFQAISGGQRGPKKKSDKKSDSVSPYQTTPLKRRGTSPETVQYVKDIVMTGLNWILSPFL